jgi:hypothetical protein
MPLSKRLDVAADQYAFLVRELGMTVSLAETKQPQQAKQPR